MLSFFPLYTSSFQQKEIEGEKSDFASHEPLASVDRQFGLSQWGRGSVTTGISWVKARDSAKLSYA